MADQGVRYVVRLDDINVSSGLRNMESVAMHTESRVASLNSTLRTLGDTLGIGIGLHELFDFGKGAVQGAADYETAAKRIKFASADFADGAKNISFINEEADKLKIPLQEATDTYGKFLAMIKGSHLAGDQVRYLHDEILTIGKIKGLDDGQVNAAVLNVGKQLEAGTLDARHFRPLEQQLSGIGQYVAKEMGITLNQLAIMRNKGKLTGTDPMVLLRAIKHQAEDLKQFLPESTSTIQSQLNDLSNSWLRFKNDLVFDNLPEIKELFQTLKDGIGWLKDHEDDIKYWGKIVFEVGKYYLEYKIAREAFNIIESSAISLMKLYTGEAALQITAVESQTVAFNELSVAMQRASVFSAAGLGSTGVPLVAAGEGTVAAGATAGATTGVLSVEIVGFAAGVLSALSLFFNGGENSKQDASDYRDIFDPSTGVMSHHHISGAEKSQEKFDEQDEWNKFLKSGYNASEHNADNLAFLGVQSKDEINAQIAKKNKADKDEAYKTAHPKIQAPTDKITGQRIISYNISIKEINGIKENKVENGGTMDTTDVATKMRDIILSIVNDSQIRAGN